MTGIPDHGILITPENQDDLVVMVGDQIMCSHGDIVQVVRSDGHTFDVHGWGRDYHNDNMGIYLSSIARWYLVRTLPTTILYPQGI